LPKTPAAHGKHFVKPSPLLNWPISQSVQPVEPVATSFEPFEHSEQSFVPFWAVNLPGSQETHLCCPGVFVAVPTPHKSQLD
jgi:hypothetical protein